MSVVLCARPQTAWPGVREQHQGAQSGPRRPGGSEAAAESRRALAGSCGAGGYRGARATAALVAAAAAAADIAEAAAPSEPSAARRGRHCRPGGGGAGRSRGFDCAVPPPPPGSCGDTRAAAGGRQRCALALLALGCVRAEESLRRVGLSALIGSENHSILLSPILDAVVWGPGLISHSSSLGQHTGERWKSTSLLILPIRRTSPMFLRNSSGRVGAEAGRPEGHLLKDRSKNQTQERGERPEQMQT